MKYKIFVFLILLICVSCTDFITNYRKKINVSGQVIETYYPDQNTIFSVRGVPQAIITFAGEAAAITNDSGRYQLYIHHDGYIALRAMKDNYLTDLRYFILRKDEHRIIDFWLEREDEKPHGWYAFSEGLTLGSIAITPNGLMLNVYGRSHLYATKLFEVENHATYRFSADVKKDVASQYIFFEVLPLIQGHTEKRQTWYIDKWQHCALTVEINDLTIIGTENIYDDDGNIIDVKEIYPQFVDIVLKIGVGGGRAPQGYFNNIFFIKE